MNATDNGYTVEGWDLEVAAKNADRMFKQVHIYISAAPLRRNHTAQLYAIALPRLMLRAKPRAGSTGGTLTANCSPVGMAHVIDLHIPYPGICSGLGMRRWFAL